jgi:hypothetical protein
MCLPPLERNPEINPDNIIIEHRTVLMYAHCPPPPHPHQYYYTCTNVHKTSHTWINTHRNFKASTHLPYLCPYCQDYAVVAIGVGDKGDRRIRYIKAFGLLFIDVFLVFNLTPAGEKPQLGYSIHCDG